MAKKDINFIKFMKPKLKEREILDKSIHRDSEYRKAGVQSTAIINVDDIGLIASVINRRMREGD